MEVMRIKWGAIMKHQHIGLAVSLSAFPTICTYLTGSLRAQKKDQPVTVYSLGIYGWKVFPRINQTKDVKVKAEHEEPEKYQLCSIVANVKYTFSFDTSYPFKSIF